MTFQRFPAPPATVVLHWGTALGFLVTAATAPVRPWGWQGGVALGAAALIAIVAFQRTPGFPPRRMMLPVIGVGMLVPLFFRVVVPMLRTLAAPSN